MGRKRIEVTDEDIERVRQLAELGMTQEEIAIFLPFGIKTLENRFREEDSPLRAAYDRGRADWKEKLVARHRDIAMGKIPDTSVSEQRKAIEFRLKCEFGFHEKMSLEHSGPGGAPIPSEIAVRFVGDEDED